MKSKIVDEMRVNGRTAEDANKAFDEVFSALKTVISREGAARVPGFGTFKVKRRAERTARNPHTGEPIRIAARDVLAFKEAKSA